MLKSLLTIKHLIPCYKTVHDHCAGMMQKDLPKIGYEVMSRFAI